MSFIQILITFLITFFGGKPNGAHLKPGAEQMNMPNSVETIDIVDIDRKGRDDFYYMK
jgi:hypothetical protein